MILGHADRILRAFDPRSCSLLRSERVMSVLAILRTRAFLGAWISAGFHAQYKAETAVCRGNVIAVRKS